MSETARTRNLSDQNQRAFWLKHLHRWHWISAGLCLVGMILFAATGITLNHAAQIEANPTVTQKEATLPADLLASLSAVAPQGDKGKLPTAIEHWLTVDDSLAREDFPDAQLLRERMRVASARWPLGGRLPERVHELAQRVETYYESGDNPKRAVL